MRTVILSERDIRREAARRAFYSNHPLIRAYRFASQSDTVPLKDFIRFVETMPRSHFNACMFTAR